MEISDVIVFEKKIYAHTSFEKDKETLQEHTQRCKKYFFKLIETKKLTEVFKKLEACLIRDMPSVYSELFWEALEGVIVLHDSGKINPVFQREVMGNSEFKELNRKFTDNKNHAPLSAYIYMDYFLGELEKVEEKSNIEKSKLLYFYEVLLINMYVVSRHHSDLANFEKFLHTLQPGGSIYNIENQVKEGLFSFAYKGKFSKRDIQRYAGIISIIKDEDERKFAKYIYTKLLFSLITAADYYATSEYSLGVEINEFGNIDEIEDLSEMYEETQRMKNIRKFNPDLEEDNGEDINYLRNKLFLEVEKNLLEGKEDNIFFLEAPTGSGKSNIAFNCSFRLAKQGLRKIMYVYPFNNLIEQNKASIEEIFCEETILHKVAVVNSVTPIKCEIDKERKIKSVNNEDVNTEYYNKALLDRQFLNYPIILTTHVSLFQTMFGNEREAVFGFHQLAGSVIVLDEIQSYKNILWTELTMFLQYMCRFLDCKVIIMSATLPYLPILTENNYKMRRLVSDRDYYFKDNRFKERVKISYELLSKDFNEDMLYEHVKKQLVKKKKILVEFINKKMAYSFFERLVQDEEIKIPVERITGDDNIVDREKILKHAKDEEFCKNGYILVATQVIEAGVDIDMDIGYKDISILDSEEQFLGRINRNYKRDGVVFYFNIFDASVLYSKSDYRISKEFTLENIEMQKVLLDKDFPAYYDRVLSVLKNNRNHSSGMEGIQQFVEEELGRLRFKEINKRMQLIDDNEWDMSVFLAREIVSNDGKKIDGREVWKCYKDILLNPPEYAEFRVRLSDITSMLNLFIYKISKKSEIVWNDRIGEIYYIENGQEYFENDVLDKKKLEQNGALFIEI